MPNPCSLISNELYWNHCWEPLEIVIIIPALSNESSNVCCFPRPSVRHVISHSHNWSYLPLRAVYGRILPRIVWDTQVHFTILEGRTLPVSTQGGCWTCTITMVSLQDLAGCTCATLKKPIRWPYDLNCKNDVRRSDLSLALYVFWLQVACAQHQHLNWTKNKRSWTSHVCHAYANYSWCVRFAHKQDFL